MKNKTIKKIESATKKVAKKTIKKTGAIIKKAEKGAGKMAKDIQKKWKDSAPARAKYEKEMEATAKKVGARGMELFNAGVKNSMKIGSDIADVVKKDINDIRNNKGKNK